MKIIKDGNYTHPTKIFLGIPMCCNHCGCVFELEEDDQAHGKNKISRDFEHEKFDPIYQVNCPCCRNWHKL